MGTGDGWLQFRNGLNLGHGNHDLSPVPGNRFVTTNGGAHFVTTGNGAHRVQVKAR